MSFLIMLSLPLVCSSGYFEEFTVAVGVEAPANELLTAGISAELFPVTPPVVMFENGTFGGNFICANTGCRRPLLPAYTKISPMPTANATAATVDILFIVQQVPK